ncbi:hypothetical protein B296_00014048 [Ensete ventricosum]|uniref:Uncharacterized protein n=1 Tax=Ensete ventricosum TaxID=4639 RepID=A0A427A487_ENSVE|nr:hypothetical protein B296_00014048 [Ensete ventricosum]
MERNGSASTSTSSLFLDRVGEVAVTLDPDGLSWKPIDFVSPLSIINFVLYRNDLYVNLDQGGDGLFNEVLNGLLSSRHDAPYPPSPQELDNKGDTNCEHLNNDISRGRASLNGANGMLSAPLCGSDDLEPLLSVVVESNGLGISKCSTYLMVLLDA